MSRRNTATKFVPIPLDGEQGWQTKQVDLVQLGTPVTLAAAEELKHYFTIFSVDPVRYQIANIRLIDKTPERASIGLAVRRDLESLSDSANTIIGKPLLSGFFSANVYADKRADGDAADTFGFILNEDQTMLNFDSIDMTPYGLMRPLLVRSGSGRSARKAHEWISVSVTVCSEITAI